MAQDILAELKKLSPSGIISLYELDTTNAGGSIDRFYEGTNEFNTNIKWAGNTYFGLPISAEGFEITGSGASPRPRLKVANITGLISAYNKLYDNLLGSKVTRIRTFVKYLDASNFIGGNPNADSTQEFPRDIYYVDRKISENRLYAEYELAASWDVIQFLPRRPVMQNSCYWKYRGTECSYSGGPVADQYDVPTADITKDVCSHRLDGCKLRFGENGQLPFGAFPGVGLSR
jgi:lambda family phage minor tail protein L